MPRFSPQRGGALEKHTVYVFFLAFFVLALREPLSPLFPFILLSLLLIFLHYAFRFRAKELLPGILLVSFFTAFFSLFEPTSVDNRVVWVSEKKERVKVALLSSGERIRLVDEARIGDIVDSSGYRLCEGNSLLNFFPRLRYTLYKKLEEEIDYPLSALVGALLFGVRYELPYAVKGYFLLSGLYPFLAISGLHVGVVVGALAFLFKCLKLEKPLLKASLSILPLLPLTGLPPSALRAYLFTLLFSLGLENYRKLTPIYLLGVVFLITVITSELSLSAILSFSAVTGILLATSGRGGILRLLKVSVAPFLFTLPIVLSVFGTVNLLSPLNSIFATFLFLPLLLLSFLGGVTLFKFDLLNRALELFAFSFIKLSQLLFHLTKGFILYSKVSFFLSGFCMVFMVALLLTGRRNLPFVPPLFLLVYALFNASYVENKSLSVEGWRLNSFRYVAVEGRVYRGCKIYSDYVLPVTRKFLYGNELFDKRAIIHPSKQDKR